MHYGRGVLFIILLLMLPHQAYSYPKDEISIHEGDESTIEFQKQIELNQTSPEYRFSISYYNVKGDFLINISSLEVSNSSILTTTNVNLSRYNHYTTGNITEIGHDHFGFTFIFNPNSQLVMDFSDGLGCSDCIVGHYWLFNLTDGDFTVLQIEFYGNNLSLNEPHPREILFYFPIVTLILVPIIRNRYFRR